jgi:DNA invertase Pin-like site-specific DNA recombinase
LTADGADLSSADDDPTRTLIRQVLAAVAQFDKSVTVLKLRAARDRKRRREGRCEGRKPFGARPAEAQVLDRIRALRRKPKGRPRLSIAAIAATLNAEGVPTRTGRPWAPGTVHGILRRISV